MSVPVYIFMYSDGTLWAANTPTPPGTATLLGVVKINSDLKPQKIFTATGTVSSNLATSNGVTTGITTQKELL